MKKKYDDSGYVFPVPILSPQELQEIRTDFERWEKHFGGQYPREMTQKTHLLFQWADRLVHHPKVIDAAQEILGPNLLCWSANLFVKNAESPNFVSWHQDAPYWGLEPHEVLTVWVALTDSDRGNGGLCVLPGSHKTELLPHQDTFGKNNLLTRGQEIAVTVDPAQTVCLELKAGEASLHHVRLVHGSGPNPSKRRRIGLAIRFIPTHVKQKKARDFAQLVSGEDRFHHFDREERLKADLDPRSVRAHRRSLMRAIQNNFLPLDGASLPNRVKLFLVRNTLPIILRFKKAPV